MGKYIYMYISRWFGRHIFGILWDHDQTCRTAAFYRGIGVVNDVSKWIGRWLVNVCPGKQSLLYCFNKDTLSAFRIRDLFWCLISFIIRVCIELINYELPNSYQNHMPNSDQSHTVTLSTEKWYDVVWHHQAKHSRHLPRLDLFTLKGNKQVRKGSVNM